MTKYDVIIIGGGPAGVSTAVYSVRGGLSVLLLHGNGSALVKASHIENFYGVGSVTGEQLYLNGIAQAKALGVEVMCEQATFAETDGNIFTVTTATHDQYAAKRLVIATGAARLKSGVKDLDLYDGKGVSYCAVCDAFFYRKKRVAVLGAGEFAEHEYNELKNVVGDVVLLTNGNSPTFTADKVYTQKITRAVGADGKLSGVELDDGSVVELDGVFVAVGVMGSVALAKTLGIMTDKVGNIKIDENGKTNVPGLYAAGDCTAGIKQVAKAVCDGMRVALSIIDDIKSEK